MCHRWIPRGYQDHKVVPELQGDVLTEVCQSHYAPQHTEKCDCDETIDCIVDSSEALVIAGGTNTFADKIFFSDRIELYQPETETRGSKSCVLPNLPVPRTEPTLDIVNGTMTVCGGDGGEHSCLVLEQTGWVETGYGLVTPRTGHVSWVADGNILFLSGGIYNDQAEIFGYDETSQFSSHIERACSIQTDDEVIITGGRDGGSWDSVSVQWRGMEKSLPPLQVGRSQHGCGVAKLEDNSKLLVVAGGYNANYEVLNTIEVLNLGTGNTGGWATLETRMPKPLNGFKMENVGKDLYLVGGKDENNEANTDIFIFDAASNQFTATPGFSSQARWNHGMASVQRTSFEEFCMN